MSIPQTESNPPKVLGNPKIAYFKDSVFTFYYPENLEALKAHGATLIGISSLDNNRLPDEIDALYIGGGFPETQADRLSKNKSLMESVREKIEGGLPVYAECGGLIYLCRSLHWKAKRFPMVNIFPIDLSMSTKPVGHGYIQLTVDKPNPFYPVGLAIKGHEFHYSHPVSDLTGIHNCMAIHRGTGIGEKREGLIYKNVLATYTHIHAGGVKLWASRLVKKALEYKQYKDKGSVTNENFNMQHRYPTRVGT